MADTTPTTDARATIGLTGLAVMGRNLARNIARQGHTIAVHNRTTEKMTSLVEQFGDEGDFVGAETVEDFVAAIQKPRAIIVMVKAGDPTDAVIDELVPLLDEGDIVVDAGNAHFVDTIRREKALSEKGIHFVGMGVSFWTNIYERRGGTSSFAWQALFRWHQARLVRCQQVGGQDEQLWPGSIEQRRLDRPVGKDHG